MAATIILVEGNMGSGKSSSWESMDESKTYIISPNSKPLPFEGYAKRYNAQNKNISFNVQLNDLGSLLSNISEKAPNVEYVLIEDITHFWNAITTDAKFIAKKSGGEAFAKWNELAGQIFSNIFLASQKMRDGMFVIINAHTEGKESGRVELLTPGKILEQQIKIPSYVTYVFHSLVIPENGKPTYKFLTNDDGVHESKTPRNCFKELYIDNDMKSIITRIKEYQGN
jgi:deoxyadenosine/deoxycytidine kinase